MGKLVLIDGNSILNRAFYAIPLLSNSEGDYTNAIYGFLNILIKQIEQEQPEYLAVAFDLPKLTFRHKLFAAYKGTRKKMPDEMRSQLPILKELLNAMKIKIFELEGYEADDILGTIAKVANSLGNDVLVVTGDRDLLQLATDSLKIRIPKTIKGKTVTEDYSASDVYEKYGVSPAEFIEVKALMGDSSDNIPGVPGIGEKTAVKIIQQFKNIETAILKYEQIKPKKASDNIKEFEEQLRVSKALVTIDIDVPIDFIINDCKFIYPISKDALPLLKQLDFKSIISKLEFDILIEQQAYDVIEESHKINFKKISDKTSLLELIKIMQGNSVVAFVLHFEKDIFFGMSVSFDENSSFYIESSEVVSERHIVDAFKPFFEDELIKKITDDAKKMMHFLSEHNISIKALDFDTMLAAYVLNPTLNSYTFDYLSKLYLNEQLESDEELLGKGKSRKAIKEITEPKRSIFLSKQANVVFRLYFVLSKALLDNLQNDLYYNIELPLAHILCKMEQCGIKIDDSGLKSFQLKLENNINSLTDEIYKLAGTSFNINSPKQLGEVLFETLKLKNGKKTKTGYSTSAEVLEKLVDEHTIVPLILEYRTYVKLKTTYCDGLLNVMKKEDNKIYSTFNQTITATGRLSSTEPNLQNIPIRLALGRELRKIFIPTNSDFIFIDGDYSQIELRVLAHMSGDESLIAAFNNGTDIHKLTASRVNKIPYDEVTPMQRSAAKAVNFGIIYGIGSFSLSQDLGINRFEAQRYINSYFNEYPAVKEYMDNLIAQAKKDGFVSTLFNRKRFVPEISSKNHATRSFGERIAMNMPIQGTAADIIKIAMCNIDNKLIELNLNAKIILQVHDELLVEAHKECLNEVSSLLKNEMENAVALKVPLDVDIHIGETWYDAK